MATTLTDAGEITYTSFPIDKMETNEDGDLIVYGKATDGSVDSDMQIVDPKFAAKAISQWKETGANIRVQHNPQRDPAGVGIDVSHDGDATWVKALVFEPIAKKLVAKGALTAYSVGISRPTIERDLSGKARGGIITNGEIVEISLVDRPANKSCGIQLVKSEDGRLEVVNEVFGDEQVIAKMIGMDVTEKSHKDMGALDGFTAIPQEDLSVSFTPNDLARLLQNKFVEKHYDELARQAAAAYDPFRYSTAEKRDFDPGVGGGVDRDKLDESDFAGPHRSFPIVTQSDVSDALHLVGHADDPAAVRARIHAIARRKGFSVPDEGSDSKKGERVTDASATTAPDVTEEVTVKEAEPVITKDPDGDKAAAKPKKGKNGGGKGKKMPPWLNQDNDDDGDDKSSKVCKSFLDHSWVGSDAAGAADVECAKCHTTPAQAAGLTSTHDMNPAPVGDLLETPAKDHMKGATPQSASGAKDAPPMEPVPAHREPDGAVAEAFEKDAKMEDGDSETKAGVLKASPEESALLRFKTIGIDTDFGRLHDLTCPAYDPEDVAKYHPFADFSNLIDDGVWQRKALESAAGRPLSEALEMQKVWQAVQLLKTFDAAVLNDFRVQAHKAFRDANPGPTSYPTPGSMSPKRFCRPVLTDGRAANSAGYGAPNSSPAVASGAPNAHSFDRPPLSAGHQSPSPSFMKGGMEYPAEQGVPMQLRYAELEKENARRALSMLHDHLNHMFPSACPMLDQDAYRQPEARQVPATAGIGKSEEITAVVKAAEPELTDVLDEIIVKGRKKMLKKLGKKVMSGAMTLDEARARVGNRMSRKQIDVLDEQVTKGLITADEARAQLGLPPQVIKSETVTVSNLEPTFDADAIRKAVSDAVAPLVAKIEQQEELLTKAQSDLATQAARWDAVANEPDPKTAAFSGLALNMVHKSARPAGVPERAEIAERTQQMIRRQLMHTWRTSENPAEREAAFTELSKYGLPE